MFIRRKFISLTMYPDLSKTSVHILKCTTMCSPAFRNKIQYKVVLYSNKRNSFGWNGQMHPVAF